MFERFTEGAIKVLMLAQEEDRLLGHNRCGSEQILLGLIGEGTGTAAQALKQSGLSLKKCRSTVETLIGRGNDFLPQGNWIQRLFELFKSAEMPFSDHAKRLLELSWVEARTQGVTFIGTEHLLLGVLHLNEGRAIQVLQQHKLDLEELRRAVLARQLGRDA